MVHPKAVIYHFSKGLSDAPFNPSTVGVSMVVEICRKHPMYQSHGLALANNRQSGLLGRYCLAVCEKAMDGIQFSRLPMSST
jgi:hypothetical protein